jgi:NADH-quinone oxidoreductase subunit H
MDYFLITTSLLKIAAILFLVILPMVSYSVYAERRLSAFIQDRRGPNRVGPAGLFQPIADMFKLLLKEDFTPANVNTFYYWLAPCLAMMPAVITIAVVHSAATFWCPNGDRRYQRRDLVCFRCRLIGRLASSSPVGHQFQISFLGGVRSGSQMISYELSLGLAVIQFSCSLEICD